MSALVAGPDLLQEPGAQISASSEASGLGIGAALTQHIAQVYRSGAEGERVIRIALAGLRELGALVLAAPADGLLCEAHARIRLTCSAVASDGADVLDTGVVCGAMPAGRWVWPIGGAVEPNRIWNPCLTDAAEGWTASGSATPAIEPASGQWRLYGEGSGLMRLAGSLRADAAMEATFAPAPLTDGEPSGAVWEVVPATPPNVEEPPAP